MPELQSALIRELVKTKIRGSKQSQELEGEVGQTVEAVTKGFAVWQTLLRLTGVRVSAVAASGGSLQAPALAPLIAAFSQSASAKAVASALGDAMGQWAATVKVPGLPWYPAFAAIPSPIAPPTPNVPSPLLALSMNAELLGKDSLRAKMKAVAPAGLKSSDQVIEAFAEALAAALSLWLASTMVTMVMGTGPVPTFAPPYVPVGPVVGGTADQLPGGMK